MKTGRALPDVLKELKRQNDSKRDYISPAPSLNLWDDGRTLSMRTPVSQELFGTTDLFHRQIGAALSIPAKYYDLMRKEKPDLLAQNVNGWLQDRDQSYMIRSMDYGEGRMARAFLSDRYRRIDNLEVASAVLPLFAGQPDVEIISSEVTESKLYIKVVNHRLEKACVGDTVQAGVVIANSEVGLGAVSVLPLIYTLACTNGMVVSSLGERKAHVGRQTKGLEDFIAYSDDTLEAEDKAFMLRLRDATLAAIEETRFSQIVDTLAKAADAPITGRVQDVIELTGKNYGLNQGEQDSILNYLIQGGDLSLYGLANAITRSSQDVDSYDRATALETMGWSVATMPATQWKEINA